MINVEKMRWLNVEVAAAVIGDPPSRFRAALSSPTGLLQHNLFEIEKNGYLYAYKPLSPNQTLRIRRHQDLFSCRSVLVELYKECQ